MPDQLRTPSSSQDNSSLKHLVSEALKDLSQLAQKEFTLFKTEMTQNLNSILVGAGMFLGAAILAIVGLSLLTQSLVDWLTVILESRALAALLCGVGFLIIAGILAMVGKNLLSSASLTPRQTVHSLRRDGEILSQKVSG